MADLDANVARRVLAAEAVEFHSLKLAERGFVGVHADVDASFGEFRKRGRAGLQRGFFTGEDEVRVGGEGRGREAGDKDGLRPGRRVREDPVRALDQRRPEAAREERLPDFLRGEFLRVQNAEIDGSLRRVGLDQDREQFPLVTADDRLHRTAHGRGQEDVRVLLVRQDGGAGKHGVTLADQEPRKEALEVGGLDGDNVRSHRFDGFQVCLPADRDVQAFFQSDAV